MMLKFENYDRERAGIVTFDLMYSGEYIGLASGYITEDGLIPTIKIDNCNQCKGYGYKAFCELVNNFTNVKCICASWNKDDEHNWCEEGMSTNLLIFKQKIADGFSDYDAAFLTPTGIWCKRLGYIYCNIKFNSCDRVDIDFYK